MYTERTESTRSSWTTTRIPFVRRRLAYRRSKYYTFPRPAGWRPWVRERTYRPAGRRLDLHRGMALATARVPRNVLISLPVQNGFWTLVSHGFLKPDQVCLHGKQALDGSTQIAFLQITNFTNVAAWFLADEDDQSIGLQLRQDAANTAALHARTPGIPTYQVLRGVLCKAPSEECRDQPVPLSTAGRLAEPLHGHVRRVDGHQGPRLLRCGVRPARDRVGFAPALPWEL